MAISRRTLLVGSATWSGVGLHTWWRRRSNRPQGLRVCSWNLRNFSGSTTPSSEHALGHDLERLAEHLARIDADVYCFQEVLVPKALWAVLPGYAIAASSTGGGHDQYLVIARRRGIDAGPARTDPCTQLRPRLRPILEQPLGLAGRQVHVVVVHLKAGRAGFETRRAQRQGLLERLRVIPRPRVVLGDFNTTGSSSMTAEHEIASLAEALASVGLQRVEPTLPCTAYWEGPRFDRYKEASTLDHVFMDPVPLVVAHNEPGTHCARLRCRPLRSSVSYPDLDYERVSDHCPLVLDVSAKKAAS